MPSRIPPPEYITETVEGAVYALPGGTLLVIGAVPETLATFNPVISDPLTVRCAIAFNTPVNDALIPGLFVSDKGVPLVGREAWDFMWSKHQLYARAEVVGFRTNGADAQVFLRELDWGAAVRVFVYATPDSRIPAAEPRGVYVGVGAAPLPELMGHYLPHVTDLSMFLGHHESEAKQ